MKRNLQRALQIMLIASGWLLNKAVAQPSASFQQYCYYYTNNVVTFAPIVSYQFDNSWYLEGRYNYEDLKTFSMYMGKTFENNSAFSYSFTPIAGTVFGTYKGGSIGANLSLEYRSLSFSSQPQYTLSLAGRENNFLYSWSDLSCQLFKGFSLGISAQHTKLFGEKAFLEKGLMMEIAFKKLAVPLYVFSPESSERYFLLGLTYEWEGKKRKKSKEEPLPATPALDSSAVVLAGLSKLGEAKKTQKVNNESKVVDGNTSIAAADFSNTGKALFKKEIADPEGSLFAVTLGGYQDLAKANSIKRMLLQQKGKQAIVYSDGGNYKIRMTGFVNRKEAEDFRSKFSASAVGNDGLIQAYQIKELQVELVEKSKLL